MPYIDTPSRDGFVEVEEALEDVGIHTAGELQFIIAVAIAEYMHDKKFCYQTMNDIMGALNGANLEFYRRVVAPYEDKCIERNGDIENYARQD